MAINAFRLFANTIACPECGNTEHFKAKSQQVAEDCCESWIECQCGFDPTANVNGHRVECILGDVSKEAIPGIFQSCWIDLID